MFSLRGNDGVRSAGALLITALALAVACVLSSARSAAAVTFEYRADWYEIDGNAWGSKDGVADLRDDFDDGTVGPYTAGTVSESGGFLHLENPGQTSADQSRPIIFEASTETVRFPQSGLGDFTATASFFPDAPASDQFYGLFLGNATPITDPNHANYSVQIGQGGPGLNAGFGVGNGVYAVTMRHLVVVGGVVQVDIFEEAIINFATDVTGDILFRLEYDDTTKGVTGSYSLDGGVNFVSPFSTGTMSAATYYPVTLIAETVTAVPEPATLLLLGSGLAGLARFGRRRKRL